MRKILNYIRKKNEGSSKIRNIGMDCSKREYLAYLDADDLWHPMQLEMQVECFRKVKDIGFVFTGFSKINMECNIAKNRYEEYAFPVFQDYGL